MLREETGFKITNISGWTGNLTVYGYQCTPHLSCQLTKKLRPDAMYLFSFYQNSYYDEYQDFLFCFQDLTRTVQLSRASGSYDRIGFSAGGENEMYVVLGLARDNSVTIRPIYEILPR
jgi:hypothetical protein